MVLRLTALLLFTTLASRADSLSRVERAEDGGYNGIVVRVSEDINMQKCKEIVAGIKVRYAIHRHLETPSQILFSISAKQVQICTGFAQNWMLFRNFKLRLSLYVM